MTGTVNIEIVASPLVKSSWADFCPPTSQTAAPRNVQPPGSAAASTGRPRSAFSFSPIWLMSLPTSALAGRCSGRAVQLSCASIIALASGLKVTPLL